MFGVTGARGSSSSRLTTTTKIAPWLVATKVLLEAVDNLQLVDKLFFEEGRDVMWVSPPNVESYPLIRVLVD
jgi:hypothetical protein